jgi:hypothetical protein
MASFDFYVVNRLSNHPNIDATIRCISAGNAIGTINFLKDGTTLP